MKKTNKKWLLHLANLQKNMLQTAVAKTQKGSGIYQNQSIVLFPN